MTATIPNNEYLGKEAVGYMINAKPSPHARAQIMEWQESLKAKFGDAVWLTPNDAMHVTLMDWLAPLVEYKEDKDRLFHVIFHEYDATLKDILSNVPAQELLFDRVSTSPAAVALVADNAGKTLNRIRDEFVSRVALLPDTKQPPQIVHSTVARFMGSVAVSDIEDFVDTHHPYIIDKIHSFRLVRETRLPMLGYTIIKEYFLTS